MRSSVPSQSHRSSYSQIIATCGDGRFPTWARRSERRTSRPIFLAARAEQERWVETAVREMKEISRDCNASHGGPASARHSGRTRVLPAVLYDAPLHGAVMAHGMTGPHSSRRPIDL